MSARDQIVRLKTTPQARKKWDELLATSMLVWLSAQSMASHIRY